MAHPTLAAARELGPVVAARSSEIEAAGRLPQDLVDLIRPSGAFRQYVPADLDGPGVTAWESLEVTEEYGFHDGAVGWCVAIASTTSLMSSYLPDTYAKEIFGNPDNIACGFAAPGGQATPVDGGLRITGRWQWGSGSRHSTWIGGGSRLVDADGKTTPRADGLVMPFVFFEPADVELIDNWDVSGLSGTGSSDYQVNDVFVPEGRWSQIGLDKPVRDNELSRFSFLGLLACGVAAAAVGIARRSIHELVELAQDKRPQGSRRTLRERTPVQADVAIAEAKLASAWLLMGDAVGDAWDTAAAGDPMTMEHKRRLRLSATHATQTAAEVTELMYKAAGGAAVYKTSPIQRCFRDVYVATQHAMIAPRTYELAGRIKLGLETDPGGL
jgi:alkylation response protein AidB-like acyl-CoA dehydrogenase